MKILALSSKLIYEIDPRKGGENALVCPVCNNDRKHKGKKSFSWNNRDGVGQCHNCSEKFVEYKPQVELKEYFIPKWKNITNLTEKAVKWFAGRAISQDTISSMKVYSDVEYMPQENAECSVICFPYFVDDKLVNIKFRDGKKNFKLVSGAELVFYNINSIRDIDSVVIVEGEMDCLSFIECGIVNCISVPNGASAKSMEFIDNYHHLFENIQKVYIATDGDIRGIELREELIRRFGQERSYIVTFGDCKDANEYLVKYGGLALSETIKNAREIQVSGIVNINDHYDSIYSLYANGMKPGVCIGSSDIDSVVTWETGRLAVVTGIPGHGKSEFVDWLVTNLNRLHGWRAAYFSPENHPFAYHFSKLASKIIGKEFSASKMTASEFEKVYDNIYSNYFFIYPEDDQSFENILEKGKYLVRKHGIKILVIDPYNKIEHLRTSGESETEYISRFLDKLVTFAKVNDVLVFLVAHPRKMDKNKDTGFYSKPNLYDINGSANFYNKCDYGFTVYRTYSDNTVSIDFIKIKFRHLGQGGCVEMRFNYFNGRYESLSLTVDQWNCRSYLEPNTELPKEDLITLPADVPF